MKAWQRESNGRGNRVTEGAKSQRELTRLWGEQLRSGNEVRTAQHSGKASEDRGISGDAESEGIS